MIKTIFQDTKNNFEWIDVTLPSAEDYEELTEKYDLHPAAVKDCLSPYHLPKCELIDQTLFVILRIRDAQAKREADDLRSLTNKIAIFSSDNYIITIHRKPEKFLMDLGKEWGNYQNIEDATRNHLFNSISDAVIKTFEEGLYKDDLEMDEHERRIFDKAKNSEKLIQNLYIIKRRASVFKRMMLLTKDVFNKFKRYDTSNSPFTTDLIESSESLYFMADAIHENVNNLLNLHISLASHRTNEVMGVLTIFSVFFLPLTFIVGLYGMNFDYMPELHHEMSYPVVVGIMLLIVILTYIWFKRKNWI
ncbi:MAG: magnesium transporter [Flammeovirgaceae bacterium]|jgi:magnesium transporter